MKNEDFYATKFSGKTLLLEDELLNLLKKTPQSPPRQRKKTPKKKQKHVKCSLTRAKSKTIKESWLLLSPTFFLSLSLSLCSPHKMTMI